MSPWASEKQRAWGNSEAGVKAMGKKKVDEFNAASEGMMMSEKKMMPEKEMMPMHKEIMNNKPMKMKETVKNHPSIPGMKIHHIHRGV